MKTCPVCDTPYHDQHATCPTDGAVLIESQDFEPGKVVRNKYRIVRKLGQGGMGSVYLAEHQLLGGQVALKFLAVELSRNPQFVKRFRNEARAAYQLRHPNIVEVTDLDQDDDGTLFIAMEFVAGPNLRTVIRETEGPLPVPRALQIARGIAAGLAAAHVRGSVHRDIKPENILLQLQPDGEVQAKVLDFGIAVMTDNITNMSHTHGLLLTPEYASPEQWRGTPASELDGRADLYALGCVLYEMLAGKTPFRAANPEGWMFQHLQGTPEPLGNLRPDLATSHPQLESVVMRLLARERDERFPSASAVLEALTPEALASPSVPVAPPTPTVEPAIPSSPASIAIPSPPTQPPARTAVPPPPVPTAELSPPPQTAEAAEPSAIPEPASPPSTRSGGTQRKWPLFVAAIVGVAALSAWLIMSRSAPTRLAAVPALSPAEGAYPEPRSITISDNTPQATIHYTTDGTTPTASSPVYTNPLSGLPTGTTVRAMATAAGHKPSSDVSAMYTWAAIKPTPPAKPPETPSETPYDQGKSAYDHKQYAQARTLFAQACDGGEARACNYLGYLYAQGLGGARDQQKARTIYQSACDQRNLSSCASLGSLYQDAGNNSEARKYFKEACDGGLAEGCTLLHGVQ
jgi:eukaryotic-like serine/threonine-protein kinase